MADDKKWTHERKKLLIATRLRHEADFSAKMKKRNTIWETILREMREIEGSFPFSRDEIARCFMNIMGTYRRIKKRNGTSGEAATSWEFFADIDEVFGSRSSIQVPPEMLEYSLESVTSALLDRPESTGTEEVEDMLTPVTSMKRKKNEVLDFLERESEKDEEIMKKIIKIESDKLEIEKEKVSELKHLRVLFERIAEQPPKK